MNTRDLLETIIQRVQRESLLRREDITSVLAIELTPGDQDACEESWVLSVQFPLYRESGASSFATTRICISPQTGIPTNIVTARVMLEPGDPLLKSVMKFINAQTSKPALRERIEGIRRMAERPQL